MGAPCRAPRFSTSSTRTNARARRSPGSFLDVAICYETLLALDLVEVLAHERFGVPCGKMKGTTHTTVDTPAVANHCEAAWLKCAGSCRVATIQGLTPHIDKEQTP